MEAHREAAAKHQKVENCLSLQEELRMSNDFHNMNPKDTDEESGQGDSLKTEKQTKSRKTFPQTPTDFSEIETSSSGFSDETSNKATQTDEKPGSFLCTIADGGDCISIYDDARSIESRFRNRPEYRALFKEIFTVLKNAAEKKKENEALPLLDDHTPTKTVPKVPPVTPSNESSTDFPEESLPDDTQSIMSSTMSELSLSQAEQTPPTKPIQNPLPEEPVKENKEPVLKPYKREPLDSLPISVGVRKRSSSRKKKQFTERSDSPVTHIVGSPKITYSSRPTPGRKRREVKTSPPVETENAWNGHSLHFWARNVASPTPNNGKANFKCDNSLEFKPSTAYSDLHKLKRLELSYAEVLRKAEVKKPEQNRPRTSHHPASHRRY